MPAGVDSTAPPPPNDHRPLERHDSWEASEAAEKAPRLHITSHDCRHPACILYLAEGSFLHASLPCLCDTFTFSANPNLASGRNTEDVRKMGAYTFLQRFKNILKESDHAD